MTKFTEQFHTNGSEIRMTHAERSRVHAALRARMNAQPVASPFFVRNPFAVRFAFALALILVVGTGSTAFAAEGTLPGDLLYPVKVSIVEPVQGALQVSDTAKARWNAEVATERLNEAQALAARGTLTPAVSDELAANFNQHASAVASAATSISASDPAAASEISANFSTTVAQRGAAILAAGKTNASVSSAKASGSLVVAIASDEDSGVSDAASSGVQPMAAMMKAGPMVPAGSDDAQAARLSIQAHAALADATSTLPTLGLTKSDLAQARARAATIANRIVKADAELSIGSTSDAVSDFNRALREINALPQAGGTPASGEDGSSAQIWHSVPVLH